MTDKARYERLRMKKFDASLLALLRSTREAGRKLRRMVDDAAALAEQVMAIRASLSQSGVRPKKSIS